MAATHPIQYQVPWFRALSRRAGIELEVGFAWLPDREAQGSGFGVPFEWDVPLLEGFAWVELERVGRKPDLDSFRGLRLRRPGDWLAGEVDALVVTGWHRLALLQVAFAARRRGIPLLGRGDSIGGRRRSLPRRLALRLFLRSFAAFLVVGKENRRFYRELGVPDSKLFSCPHFVDNRFFAEGAARAVGSRSLLRERWGVAPEEIAVLFCGKFIAEKNPRELLEAIALAVRSAPLRAVFVGDGPLRSELERRASALRMPVTWDGFRNQSELPAIYAAADLLVLPSRSETWGLVINEALACGLTVVASDQVGCASDLVLPGRTGETYPSGRAAALAELLVRLARDPDCRHRLGQNGRRLVTEEFSVERAVEGTEAALATVTNAA